ncbi:MAG: phytanoyl-CoA dioxygenase family protein [Capsulimonadaceae bacterium]|nr:phytanoyl-CoA dioxygenase family protein [Capsulimonadaceae bacterium]
MENEPFHAAGQISGNDISNFRESGYLALPGVLSPSEVCESRQALTELVEAYAALSPSQRNDADLWLQFEPGFDPDTCHDREALELHVRKFMRFVDLKPALKRLVEPSHRLMQIVSQLIGPDPILFQDMALVKPPFIGSEKPWHQDNAYFSVAPLDSVCGVWIALDDATVDNGCMYVIPGWHKRGALGHHHGTDCEIAARKLPVEEAVPVPIAAGGAMFFYGMLPHQTPPNTSPARRRALQYHFRGANSRVLGGEEYDRLYADETGAPASCAAARARGV